MGTKVGRLLGVPLLALLWVFAAALSGYAADFPQCTNSGACGIKVYLDRTSTKVGGAPVNIAINVLDSQGKVNTVSNGQVGDVLFEITSQLATPGTIGGNVGTFASDVLQYGRPAQGVFTTNIQYNQASGTDTIRIRVYEAVTCPGATNPAQTCPGQLLAEETYQVNVEPTSPVVRNINAIQIASGPNVDDGNVGLGGTLERVWGRTVNGDGVGGGNDVVRVEAGSQFGVQVNAPATENGQVKVAFLRVAAFNYQGAATPAITQTFLPPVKVGEVELTMANGRASGTASLTTSGYYLVVAYSQDQDGNIVAQTMMTTGGNVLLLRVDPKGVPGGSPEISQISLSADRNLLQINTNNHPVRIQVCLLDEYGNPTYSTSPVTVSFSGATGVDTDGGLDGNAGGTILANWSCDVWQQIDVPNSAAPITLTASAMSLTSNSVAFNVTTGNQMTVGAGNGIVVVDEDGTEENLVGGINGLGVINFTAGGRIRITLDNNWDADPTTAGTQTLAAGSQVCIQFVRPGTTQTIGDPICTSFDPARTEAAVAGADLSGDGDQNDYVLDFPVTQAVPNGAELLVYVKSGTSPLPAPVLVQLQDINAVYALGSATCTDGGNCANAVDDDGDGLVDEVGVWDFGGVVVHPAAVASYSMVNLLGEEVSSPVINMRYGRQFTIWGQQFVCRDQYGNLVPPSNGGPQFVTVQSDNFDAAFNVAAGSNVAEYIPAGAPGKTALNLNICSTYADVDNAATTEMVNFAYGNTVSGTDTLKFYTNFSTVPFELQLTNIGNPYTKIEVRGPGGVTDNVTMPLNGVIPIEVVTTDDNGNLIFSDDNDLILHVSSNLVSINRADGGATYATGFQFDTIASPSEAANANDEFDTNTATVTGDSINGRVVFMAAAGLSTGQVEVWVTNTSGTLESNHLVINVQPIAPTPPCSADNLSACDEAQCAELGLYWYDNACHAEPATLPDNEADCEAAGYYWNEVGNGTCAEAISAVTPTEFSGNPVADLTYAGDAKAHVDLVHPMAVPADDQGQRKTVYFLIGVGDQMYGIQKTCELFFCSYELVPYTGGSLPSLGQMTLGSVLDLSSVLDNVKIGESTYNFNDLPLSDFSGEVQVYLGYATGDDRGYEFTYYTVVME